MQLGVGDLVQDTAAMSLSVLPLPVCVADVYMYNILYYGAGAVLTALQLCWLRGGAGGGLDGAEGCAASRVRSQAMQVRNACRWKEPNCRLRG